MNLRLVDNIVHGMNFVPLSSFFPALATCVDSSVFSALLEMLVDGIEISYNSAGVLAHMVSDGDAAWTKVNVSRQEVMDKIIKACFFPKTSSSCLVAFCYEERIFMQHSMLAAF